jgi:imidazolonepropionase-like amidohydrolase
MRTKLIALFLLVSSPVMAQTVAIHAGNLVDTAKGATAKDQIILIENGKIKSVGAGLTIPKDAQVVDLSNEWVTPGLIDAHTHLTLAEIPGKAPFEAAYLQQSSTFRGFRGLHNGQIILQAGFTTVREVGNEANYACADPSGARLASRPPKS